VINRLLHYPKDSAGSLMTTEYVAFRPEATVAEAFAHLKRVAIDKETVYTCYVIDKGRHLLGLVTVKDLLLAEETATVGDVMEEDVIFVSTHTDDEEVVSIFDRYRFLALPVVDGENRLVGIITVDDAMEVMQENSEDDFAVMAAITPTEKPYLKTSVLSLWKSRFPWLLILMLSATFTGIIISHFESALAACVVLTAFIPMLMGTGGNSGSQSSVTVIRAISLGQLSMRNWFAVLWKELRVSVLCALVLSLATFGKILLVDGLWMGAVDLAGNGILVAFTVSVALALTVIAAKLIGGFLPLVAHKVGLDPAVMASPFITTAVDAVSLVLYFAIASAVLGV
jgi:magnesium transporter